MERDVIISLARSLRARLFMNLLTACFYMSPETALRLTRTILTYQMEGQYTALDWILATHQAAQAVLPERCESKQIEQWPGQVIKDYEASQDSWQDDSLRARERRSFDKALADSLAHEEGMR